MAANWWIRMQVGERGPCTREEIAGWVRKGTLPPWVGVRKEGWGRYITAQKCAESLVEDPLDELADAAIDLGYQHPPRGGGVVVRSEGDGPGDALARAVEGKQVIILHPPPQRSSVTIWVIGGGILMGLLAYTLIMVFGRGCVSG